jgi:hypothetical protein
MPLLDGGALIREIAQISPLTTGIIITAGTVDAAEVPPGVPVLRKPFTIGALLAAVDAVRLRAARHRAG